MLLDNINYLYKRFFNYLIWPRNSVIVKQSTPGARRSAESEDTLPRSRSCFRTQRLPNEPEMLARRRIRELGKGCTAALPGWKRALTRLWFRIGEQAGQEAGAGGPNAGDWLTCPSLLLAHQSPCTRHCGESTSGNFSSRGPAF